jgi:hypothetical protein
MRALENHSSEGGLTATEVRDQCATTLGSEDIVLNTMEEDDQEPTAMELQAPEMLASDQDLREGVMTGSRESRLSTTDQNSQHGGDQKEVKKTVVFVKGEMAKQVSRAKPSKTKLRQGTN